MITGELFRLRCRWALAAILYAITILCCYVVLDVVWSHALRWLCIAALTCLYLLFVLWRNLPSNHRESETLLLPTLGFGNALSLVRGVCIAIVAGFIGSPWPDGYLAWAPLLITWFYYVADCFDGYVARLQNHSTVLGGKLDLEFDKVGVSVGIALAVWYGQLPLWYLLLGFGGQLFTLTFWLRSKWQLPIYDLPPSIYRRLFAGIQMWTIASVFAPMLTSDITTFAGTVTGLFAAIVFVTDWLIVCGYIDPKRPHYQHLTHRIHIFLSQWLPLLLRTTLAISLTIIMSKFANPFAPQEWVDLYRLWNFVLPSQLAILTGTILVLGIFVVVLGVLGRIWAIAMVYPLYFEAVHLGFQTVDAFALGSCILLVVFGYGRFTLWQPDEEAMNRYIYRRLD